MKRIIAFALACFSLVVLACQPVEEDSISVSMESGDVITSSLKFGGHEEPFHVIVNSSKKWVARIAEEDSWLKVVPNAGMAGSTDVQIKVEDKLDEGPRRATIQFFLIGGSMTCDVDVMQIGGFDFIEVVNAAGDPLPDELSFKAKPAPLTVIVNTGRKWQVKEIEGDWLSMEPSEGQAGQSIVQIKAKNYLEEGERTGVVHLSLIGGNAPVYDLKVRQKGEAEPLVPQKIDADLLDVEFDKDGKAHDRSSSRMAVEYLPGASHMNYYNELYHRNAAHFSASPASVVHGGFYKVDYASNADFINKLKDGHSLEVVFSTGTPLDKTNEVKIFSSHQSGGTGMMTKDGEITFLPNVGGWKFTRSGVKPEPGRFYHAVGVWDKDAGKSYIYVDGEKRGEISAAGELTLSSIKWFGIGCDSGSSGEAAWNGDIVIARIYDQVLTPGQVKTLYEEVKVDQSANLYLTDVQYLPTCSIAAGNKYHIYAQGFKSGDKVCFTPLAEGEQALELEGKVEADQIIVTIPSSLKSGKYTLSVKRGTSVYPIGPADFVVGSTELVPVKTQIVAHRCYHKNFGANTLKAFVDTENRGIWGAEIDVHITKDDKVVVDHNGFLNNVWDDAHRFSNHTLAEIKAAHPDIPTFDEFLEAMTDGRVKELNMVLEIKGQLTTELNYRLVDLCCELIDEYEAKHPGLEKRIVWISFGKEICKRVVDKKPGTMTMYLGNPAVAPKECYADGIMGIDYNSKSTSSEWIREAHELGMVVNVWTVNGKAEMSDFIGKGVDYITTDEPDILKTLLEREFITE